MSCAGFDSLREACAVLAAEGEQPDSGSTESDWEREALQTKAQALWRRARSELRGGYAIGFLGAGMRRPLWSPSELYDEGDEYGCFDHEF